MLITYIAVFILGSLWGSFSNVCIFRLPEGGNIVSARSACRSCQSKISWFDNIPFISFIILKGKCRNCDFKIPYQYFLVELIVGLGFLISYYFYGVTVTTLLLFILIIFSEEYASFIKNSRALITPNLGLISSLNFVWIW